MNENPDPRVIGRVEPPSCPACYRPTRLEAYCPRCEASGAAKRHRDHPHRKQAP